MKIVRLIAILFSLILQGSCGKPSQYPSKQEVKIDPQYFNPGTALQMLENQNFECSPMQGRTCPPGLSRAFIFHADDPERMNYCTGFLVARDKIITNSHCIPNQAACDLSFFSINTLNRPASARCKSIVKSMEEKLTRRKGIDFAIVLLDQEIAMVPPLQLSTEKTKKDSKATVWVMDHIDEFRARMTELNCSLSKRGNALELSMCPAIAGNSGSPIMDEKNLVIGLLWGSNSRADSQTPLDERRALTSAEARGTDVSVFRKYIEP